MSEFSRKKIRLKAWIGVRGDEGFFGYELAVQPATKRYSVERQGVEKGKGGVASGMRE